MNFKSTKPVFSVVMPMYNVQKYVAKAIDSVLAQTYSQFELICVNDGCTDDTMEIVKRYEDPRIRIINQSNMGLSAARNTGIQWSRGLYVALLDSDDFWSPNKLQRHFQHFRNNPNMGVSYSASKFVNDSGEELGIGQYPKLDNISPADIFCRNPIGNGSAAVLRKSMLMQLATYEHKHGTQRLVCFDERLRQSEDVEFWLRAALTSKWEFKGIGEGLTYYRVNASGLSANLTKQFSAWKLSVANNRHLNPTFFDNWTSLASAYQKRYLARRAIQSRNTVTALSFSVGAIYTNWRILKDEPSRTLTTLAAACLCCLPNTLYEKLERGVMAMSRFIKEKNNEKTNASLA